MSDDHRPDTIMDEGPMPEEALDQSLSMNSINEPVEFEEFSKANSDETGSVIGKKKMSKIKLALYSMIITFAVFTVIFLVNGAVMSLGFYHLYKSVTPESISKFVMTGFEDLDANMSFNVAFETSFFSRLVSAEVSRGSKMKVILPGFSSSVVETKNPAIVTVEIPDIKLKRGDNFVKVKGMKAKVDENIPLSDVVLWYMSRTKESNFAIFEYDIEVYTSAFLIPFSYRYSKMERVELSSSAPAGEEDMISLNSLKFSEINPEEGGSQLFCTLDMKLSKDMMPKFLDVTIPEFKFGLEQLIDEKHPKRFLQIHTGKRRLKGGEENTIGLSFEMDQHDGKNLKVVLKKVSPFIYQKLTKDCNFDVAFCGIQPGDSGSKLQKWLATLRVQTSFETLVSQEALKLMPQSEAPIQETMTDSIKRVGLVLLKEGKAKVAKVLSGGTTEVKPSKSPIIWPLFQKPAEEKQVDPIAFGFVGVGDTDSTGEEAEGEKKKVPEFIFRLSVSTHYIWNLTGFNLSKLEGTIPAITFTNVLHLDATTSSEEQNKNMAYFRIEHEKSDSGRSVSFRFIIGVRDMDSVFLVAKKLYKLQNFPSFELSEELAQLKKISISGDCGGNILSNVLSAFEFEWNLVENGYIGPTKIGWTELDENYVKKIAAITEDLASRTIKPSITRADRGVIEHSMVWDLKTTSNNILLSSKIQLSKEAPVKDMPYVYLYWNDFHLSVRPMISGGLLTEAEQKQEMAYFAIPKGHLHYSLGPALHPALLLYRGTLTIAAGIKAAGAFDYDTIFRGTDEADEPMETNKELPLVKIWRIFAEHYTDPRTKIGVNVLCKIDTKSMSFESYLPTHARELSKTATDREERTIWLEKILWSTFSLAGVRGGVLNFFIHLPDMTKMEVTKIPQLALNATFNLPKFGVNVCMDSSVIDRKRELLRNQTFGSDLLPLDLPHAKREKKCLFKVGFSKPLEIKIAYYQGVITAFKTTFEAGEETIDLTTSLALPRERSAKSLLENRLPLFFSVEDLDSALSVFPDLFGADLNKGYTVTLGYSDPAQYHNTDIVLLERFLNGFVGDFFMPRFGDKGFSQARNLVTDKPILWHKALRAKIEVQSPDRNKADVKISFSLPPDCFGKTRDEDDDLEGRFSSQSGEGEEVTSGESTLSVLDWGETNLQLTRGNSHVHIKLHQGKIRLSNEGKVSKKDLKELSKEITITMRMDIDDRDFNSDHLQTLKNYLVTAFNLDQEDGEEYPKHLRQVASLISKTKFQMAFTSHPYRSSGKTKSSKKEASPSTSVKEFNGQFVIHLMQFIYGYMQRRSDDGQPGMNFAFVLKPERYAEDKSEIVIPNLFDYNCQETKDLMVAPADRRMIGFTVEVQQLVYHVLNMFAQNFAFILKNISLQQYPGLVDLTVKIPKMNLFGTVNGVSLAEAELDEMKLERRLPLFEKLSTGKYVDPAVDDRELVTGRARWGSNFRDFADIISPAHVVMDGSPTPMLHPHPINGALSMFNSPMTMAFSTVECEMTNLISSLFCAWYGEQPISSMLKEFSTHVDDTKQVKMEFDSVSREELKLRLKNIHIPWPVPKMELFIEDEPVTLEFVYRGLAFVRVFIKKGLRIKEPSFCIEEALLVLNKTAFGEFDVDRFSQDFAEFMGILALSVPGQFDIVVHIGEDRLKVVVPLYVPRREAKLSFFNQAKSTIDIPLLNVVSAVSPTSMPKLPTFVPVTRADRPPLKRVPLREGGDGSSSDSELAPRSVPDDYYGDDDVPLVIRSEQPPEDEPPVEITDNGTPITSSPHTNLVDEFKSFGETSTESEESSHVVHPVESSSDEIPDIEPKPKTWTGTINMADTDSHKFSLDTFRSVPLLGRAVNYVLPKPVESSESSVASPAQDTGSDESDATSPVHSVESSTTSESQPKPEVSGGVYGFFADKITGAKDWAKNYSLPVQSDLKVEGAKLPRKNRQPGAKPPSLEIVADMDANLKPENSKMTWFLYQQNLVYDQCRGSPGSTYDQQDLLAGASLKDQVWLGSGMDEFPGTFFGNYPVHNTPVMPSVVNYYLSFKNDNDMQLDVLAQILHLEFKVRDSSWGTGPVIGRMNFLGDRCQWEGYLGAWNKLQRPTRNPRTVDILRCVHHNVHHPATRTRPGCDLQGSQRPKATVLLDSYGLRRLQMETATNGICFNVRDSNVAMAIFDPKDESKYIILDLVLNMFNMPNPPPDDPHADPCYLLFDEISDTPMLRWGRKESVNYLTRDHLMPIKDERFDFRNADTLFYESDQLKIVVNVDQKNYNIAVWGTGTEITYLTEERSVDMDYLKVDVTTGAVCLFETVGDQTRKVASFGIGDTSIVQRSMMFAVTKAKAKKENLTFLRRNYSDQVGMFWEAEPIDLDQPVVVDLDLEANYKSSADTGSFGFCWKVASRPEELGTLPYGRSLCLTINTADGTATIVDGQTNQVIARKPRAACIQSFFGKARKVKLLYNPAATKNKLVLLFDPDSTEDRYSSGYDIDIGKYLRTSMKKSEKIYFGLLGRFSAPGAFQMQLHYLLPDLLKTRMFFGSGVSPLPGETFDVYFKLYDPKGRPMKKSALGFKVELWQIDPRYTEPSEPRSPLFRWSATRPKDDEKKHLGFGALQWPTSKKNLNPEFLDLTRSEPASAVAGKVVYMEQSGFYKVTFKVDWSGRYRVMVAFERFDDRLDCAEGVDFTLLQQHPWFPVRNAHVYVRNYYEVN